MEFLQGSVKGARGSPPKGLGVAGKGSFRFFEQGGLRIPSKGLTEGSATSGLRELQYQCYHGFPGIQDTNGPYQGTVGSSSDLWFWRGVHWVNPSQSSAQRGWIQSGSWRSQVAWWRVDGTGVPHGMLGALRKEAHLWGSGA